MERELRNRYSFTEPSRSPSPPARAVSPVRSTREDGPTEAASWANAYPRPQIDYYDDPDFYNRPSYPQYDWDAVPHHTVPQQPYYGSPFEGGYEHYETAGTSSMSMPSTTYEDSSTAPSWGSQWKSESSMKNKLFNSVKRPSSPEHSTSGRTLHGEDEYLEMYKHATRFTNSWFEKNKYQVVPNGGDQNNCLLIALLEHATGFKENLENPHGLAESGQC